ncbi:hypothetical protein DFH06DRAFT_1438407 [Mycena polygramma]|nr:hypothetical protein DFH06DRAFT_1438407 [Mycena polygramma]
MSSPLVAFIIGAGKNVGQNTAAALKAKGYKVAIGSRKPVIDQVKKDGHFPVAIDAQSVESVQKAFAQINKELGPPNVVIFNASTFVKAPIPADPLTLSVENFRLQTDFTVSVYAAAQEALKGFRSDTHKNSLKTFIITGNPLPWIPVDDPVWLGGSVLKLIEWRLAGIFALAYAKENIRFYFASLVGDKGGIVEPLSSFFTSGPQHAQVYTDLITRADHEDWDYRFTLDAKKWTK